MARSLPSLGILFFSMLFATAGCGDKKDPNAATQASAEHAAARKTFDTNCAKCHTIDGPMADAAKMMKGPDLAKVGALPEHNREWILKYIRDPQSQNARSKMPKFGGKLKEEDLGALADYLASRK